VRTRSTAALGNKLGDIPYTDDLFIQNREKPWFSFLRVRVSDGQFQTLGLKRADPGAGVYRTTSTGATRNIPRASKAAERQEGMGGNMRKLGQKGDGTLTLDLVFRGDSQEGR